MTQTLETPANVTPAQPVRNRADATQRPSTADVLRAWGLDSTTPQHIPPPQDDRAEVKPLGVVCEPVN